MAQSITYLETNSTNPYYNLAFEEYVLTHRKDGMYLLLWQNDNTIVVGRNQNTQAEVNQAFVDAHHINVVRRTTGGGAVYHDLGNLNYSFITDATDPASTSIAAFAQPIIDVLAQLGVTAELTGRNDILLNGQKISGTAQRLVDGRILHHGTLLFDSDFSMIANALQVDETKFQSKGVKSVRARVGNIRPALPQDMELPAFWDYLKTSLAGHGYKTGALTPAELTAVETLKTTQYDTWDWNYGRSPQYTLSNKRRWSGGGVEVRITVEQGHITDLVFFGDFLAISALDELVGALKGCAFSQEAVATVLASFDLQPLFGGITQQELLETMFYQQ